MSKFLKNGLSFLALLLSPFLVLLALYIHFDPFQVVKKYSTYHFAPVDLNRDYISTEIYLANRQKYNYNSFIFGSSRAVPFNPNSWAKHLDEKAVPFAFDATGESIYGIYTKLKFLDNEKTDIDNVLILFCRGAFRICQNQYNHLVIKHPKTSGENWGKFHFIFFKAYFNIRFLLGYYSFLITGNLNSFTHGIIQDKGLSIDYSTNHITLDKWDNQLNEDSKRYYEIRRNIFYNREGEKFENDQEISETSLRMLIGILEILERNHSHYKIILSPIYDQIKFSIKDKEYLTEVFGDHLYDFTGKNFITENDTNWYETFHFRPFIADSIMNIVYSENNTGNNWR